MQGKQLFFASQAPDPHLELGRVIELKMPIEVFWEAEKVLKKVTYLSASGEPLTEINVEVNRLYQLLAPFCVDEANRIWMVDKVRR